MDEWYRPKSNTQIVLSLFLFIVGFIWLGCFFGFMLFSPSDRLSMWFGAIVAGFLFFSGFCVGFKIPIKQSIIFALICLGYSFVFSYPSPRVTKKFTMVVLALHAKHKERKRNNQVHKLHEAFEVTEKVPQEEENRLYCISVIPAVIVFAILASFYGFVHLEQVPPTTSLMWDLFLNFFLPLLVTMPASFFMTYEILSSRTKSSIGGNVKRFLGRIATVYLCELIFILVYLASYFFLAPIISERLAMLCSLLIWLLILIGAVAKFRDFFDRLEKGKW